MINKIGKYLYELKRKLADYLPLSDSNGHIVVSGVLVFIFGLCALIFVNDYYVSGLIGAVASSAVGLLSELNDERQPGNSFSFDDLYHNTIGIIIAFVAWGFIGAIL